MKRTMILRQQTINSEIQQNQGGKF